MRYGLALLSLLACLTGPAALAGGDGAGAALQPTRNTADARTLTAGTVTRLPLDTAAGRVVVRDARVAGARIASDRLVVIEARKAGQTSVEFRDPEGALLRLIMLTVQEPASEATGSLPPRAGPSLPHAPTSHDIHALMGSGWMKLAGRHRPMEAMPAAEIPLAEGARVRPPLGWHQFCTFYPAECDVPDAPLVIPALTEHAWRQLVAVNLAVNRRIKPMSDMDHHGVMEHWDYPMDGLGDCEDYALLKRRLLIEAGWPRQALSMTVVRDRQGDGHAVLAVRTDHGDMILDNQVADVLPWAATGYRYVKRQSATNPNRWVSLDGIDTAPAVVAGAGN